MNDLRFLTSSRLVIGVMSLACLVLALGGAALALGGPRGWLLWGGSLSLAGGLLAAAVWLDGRRA